MTRRGRARRQLATTNPARAIDTPDRLAGTGSGAITSDWIDFLASNPTALGTPFAAGTDVWAQAWFRDPPSPGKTDLAHGLPFVTTH